MTVRQKGKWKNNPDAYKKRQLHLNLSRAADAEGEAGRQYDFRFLTDAEVQASSDLFYPLHRIPQVEDATELHEWLLEHDLAKPIMKHAFGSLCRLYKLFHDDPVVSYYLEADQTLDRVLNIFIRVNSGATKLSYSDLLMSIAAAQWSGDDAREMVHGLVDELNSVGDGFDFSKDFVLKAGLMLSDIASVGFKVDNFNAGNMAKLRRNWDRVGDALKTTVRLADSFGVHGKVLTADSALLPIAYHVANRGVGHALLSSSAHRDERATIGFFLRRSLLKSGVWGSGLDVTLTALREVLRESAGAIFPAKLLEKKLASRGRSLTFGPDEIEELLDTRYGDKRVMPLLSILFPSIDLNTHLHVDHIFPRSDLTRPKLRKLGLDPDTADELVERRDELPNLQLLDGTENAEKSAKSPAAWLAERFPSDADRLAYADRHLLGHVPASAADLLRFLKARRDLMRERLVNLLS